ncbi:cyclase family protein [Aestuariivivens sediminicola]|uniref:cyclase family protein n=1 Tax=Aestuariivivens sediminicola TaxID=2913560 RepID=UPI001F59A623|nr:cyclase family protein [Aestuariivivens sediminicola]
MYRRILIVCIWVSFMSCKNDPESNLEAEGLHFESLSRAKIVDLSYDFSDETIYWVTAKEFHLDTVAYGDTEAGFFYAANNFSTAEHGGTHIDAPIHFAKDGQTVDQIPLQHLVGKAIKIDVSEKALNNPDYLVSIADILDWEKKEQQQIPVGGIVLLETGYSKYYPDKLKYLGTEMRGPEAIKDLHFPGLDPDAAAWLVENRDIHAIGIDTPSIDYGQSTDFKSHVVLLGHNIPAFENLTQLDKLPSNNFMIFALPIKIKGGSGGPLRIIALTE